MVEVADGIAHVAVDQVGVEGDAAAELGRGARDRARMPRPSQPLRRTGATSNLEDYQVSVGGDTHTIVRGSVAL